MTRKEQKAASAARILDAARELFTTRPYEDVTIRAVAAEAGLSTGSVFASYPGKVELYACVFGHPPVTPEVGRLLAMLPAAEGAASVAETIRDAFVWQATIDEANS